jgi:4-hydroxy-3-methylbut-2-enyl diphosphate reductase
MQVYIAKNIGYCKGVEYAVETARKIAKDGVYILGDLIHNELVVNELEKLGAKTVYSIDEIPNNSTVIIRSH